MYKDVPHSIKVLLEDYCLNREDTLIGNNPEKLFENITTLLKSHSPHVVSKILKISETFIIMINEL